MFVCSNPVCCVHKTLCHCSQERFKQGLDYLVEVSSLSLPQSVLCPRQALLRPFSDSQKGSNTSFTGEEGRGGCYTVHWHTRTHTHAHTAKEATPQEGKRTEDGWNKGPSADSGGDDDVPVCPLRQRRWQSWWGNGQSAPPGVDGKGCQSDTPPHHQALLPGS